MRITISGNKASPRAKLRKRALEDMQSRTIPAGRFGEWLQQMRRSLRDDGGTDVPCGDCVGCCVSAYYIPLRTGDRQALPHIPQEFVITVNGQPSGHTMMGYRADGSCPMLHDKLCSIYEQRPQTCRDYDCRIFAAAGIAAGGEDKSVINERVSAWRFTYGDESERQAHEAVAAAARFIQNNGAHFPGGRAPTASTGIAVLAIKSYAVFLDADLTGKSPTDIARAIVQASGEFDAEAPLATRARAGE